jgi:hypothetical protein
MKRQRAYGPSPGTRLVVVVAMATELGAPPLSWVDSKPSGPFVR